MNVLMRPCLSQVIDEALSLSLVRLTTQYEVVLFSQFSPLIFQTMYLVYIQQYVNLRRSVNISK